MLSLLSVQFPSRYCLENAFMTTVLLEKLIVALILGENNSLGAGKLNLQNLVLNRNYLSQILVKGI